MKELRILLTSWLVCVNAQLIFPDQLAVLRDAENNRRPSQSPFPNLPSNNFDGNGYDDIFLGTPNIQHSPAIPSPGLSSASSGSSSGPSSSVPMFPPTGNGADNEAQYWSNHVNNLIARGVTKFTLDMDLAIHRTQKTTNLSDKENIIFSPLSLVGTLAMVLLGSAGVTFDEAARILGLESGVDISAHSEIVHQMFGLLLDTVNAKVNTDGPRVTMASGVFVQNGYPIRPEFKAISQHVYKREVINLDFLGHSNEARQTINDWVKARTNGKIKSILAQPLDTDTKLILASALYFNGEWNKHFIHGATKRKPFMVTRTKSVMVDMMYNGGDFPFYEDKQLGVKIVALPYKGYDLAASTPPNFKYQASMYVLLPTSRDENALNNLENRLTPEILDFLTGNMVNQSCILGLPRMKLSSSLNLNDPLIMLGLSSLFDPRRANLGLLTPGYSASTKGEPDIFSRIGEDDNNNGTEGSNVNRSAFDPSTKKSYFRYEDKKGGYNVKQWNSGVIIEKIRRSLRRRRSLEAQAKHREDHQLNKGKRAGATREEAETYEIPYNSTDRVKIVAIGEEKYKFEPKAGRSKRQSRPIDEAFVRFLQSREIYSKFGLDTLRNSNNIRNPGLFASDVLHKVEMDVTETGTVGAAATTILLQRGGDIKRLIAEKPFLFFIRHESSKLILFWGTVNKPTPNY